MNVSAPNPESFRLAFRQFRAMVVARTMEFVRDKGTFSWSLFFPVALVLGFAFAFSNNDPTLFKVGVVGTAPTGHALSLIEQWRYIPYTEAEEAKALDRLAKHELDLILDWKAGVFRVNPEAKSGLFLRRFLEAQDLGGLTEAQVTGQAVRYVDWVVPGVIGMNLMFSCLFGVGYVLVRYRKNGVLKRMKATPVSAFNFLSAQALSRFLIVLVTSVAVFSALHGFLGFLIRGSVFDLLLLVSLGITCMIALGLLFASRFKSEELAGGLLNLITTPMVLASGVFFSLEGTPEILQTLAQTLPLTHLVQGARAVMLDGAGLAEIWPHLLYLGTVSLGALGLGAWLFKWE